MVWAVSTLIFILTVTLGFMLVRNFVKLWIDRRRNREGSKIRTKLVLGALALTITPVVFLVFFSIGVLNINFRLWFTQPAENIRLNFIEIGAAIERENRSKAEALAMWIAQSSEVAQARQNLHVDLKNTCQQRGIAELRLEPADGAVMWLCGPAPPDKQSHVEVRFGDLVLRTAPVLDLARIQHEITEAVRRYHQLAAEGQAIKRSYLQLLVLITLFILFFATWLALFLAKQISVPITALLAAAQEIRKGNLGTKVEVGAVDELASLVRAFNEMSLDLEANSRELENRRRFTEAILESIPTGVISLASDGRVQRVNRALKAIFDVRKVENAVHLDDLFPSEHAAELRYLMKRARRTGLAASQVDLERPGQVLHLALTVSALPAHEPDAPGYVVVLEDTSEMLRAQKAEAWHEVARRIAHELKNPLTPIALSAERIARQLDRGASTADSHRVLRECAATISREVESVKTLADEFSQFSRFPKAQMIPSDLNAVVRNGLDVFDGRLEGIEVRADLAPDLPRVNVDPDQFKRVVVNLVDNAAEAMRDAMVKQLMVITRVTSADSVELLIADTGCGIAAGDKEKLFLPYFSTKGRGTGLGLAIVSHILSEHSGRIRVDDNRPAGTRLVLEVPVAMVETVAAEAEVRA